MSANIDWTPPRTHNRPPLELAELLTPEEIERLLDETFALHAERAKELMAAEQRFALTTVDGIGDEATAERATDFIRQLKEASKRTDESREKLKRPVLVAQRLIDGRSNQITGPLDTAAQQAAAKITAFLKRKVQEERARAAAETKRLEEEAARALAVAAEAAQAADAETHTKAVAEAERAVEDAQEARAAAFAPAADLSRTRTTLGGVASLKQNWTFEVTDKAALVKAIAAGAASLDCVLPNEAVLRAIAKTQKGRALVAGVRFFDAAGATIR